MANSSKAVDSKKPAKPRADFPLYPHASGRWAKKVRQKTLFFGPWSDAQAALDKWLAEKDYWLAGRTPPANLGGVQVRNLLNNFLAYKQSQLDSNELAPRTFDRYKITTDLLADVFTPGRLVDDLRTEDFERLRNIMAKRWGPVALGNEIQMIRTCFKYGYESGLLEKPMRFGPAFKKPSAKTLRQTRGARGPRLFTPAQVHSLLKHATVNGKAMILLALNGGLGNSDLALMPVEALDLQSGWLDYARAKTAVPRRIPLWAETVAALRAVAVKRPQATDPDEANLVFIARRGESYIGDHKGQRVVQEYARAAKLAKVEGRTFYDFRRTFQTIAEGAHDLVAVQSIMGHAAASGDMSAIYRQSIEDARLQAVVAHVRTWLYSKKPKAK